MRVIFVLLTYLVWECSCKEFKDKLDRYIIACHSTDYECFKRQYGALRDNVLLGNARLRVPPHEPYMFQYGNGTCIKLTGWEESVLTGIQLDGLAKELTWTLELPFRIQQVKTDITKCAIPEHESGFVWLMKSYPGGRRGKTSLHRTHWFEEKHFPKRDFDVIESKDGMLKKFSGNATIEVIYPFEFRKKKGDVHMLLKDENLDVTLDIPDLSHYDTASDYEKSIFELSEWAYGVVQHVDAAQHFALPYTGQYRAVTELLPFSRFFLLYPEEELDELRIKHSDDEQRCYNNFSFK